RCAHQRGSAVIAALALGLLAGTGVVLIVTGFAPAPAPLASQLAAMQRRPQLAPADESGQLPRRVRLIGAPLIGTSAGKQLTARLASDLRVTGTTAVEHLAERAALALCGLLWAPVTAAMLRLAGVDTGIVLPLWVSLVLAPVGFF